MFHLFFPATTAMVACGPDGQPSGTWEDPSDVIVECFIGSGQRSKVDGRLRRTSN
jgi:hypothetical protein